MFDRQQVTAIDGVELTSLEPPCESLTGDWHAHHELINHGVSIEADSVLRLTARIQRVGG